MEFFYNGKKLNENNTEKKSQINSQSQNSQKLNKLSVSEGTPISDSLLRKSSEIPVGNLYQ